MNQNLKKILIKSKKQVFSEVSGNNSSKLKGEGYDFLELKEYEYGEDVKNIDWTISAKLRRPYVKVFHAQKELNINIVPILNGSLYFGTSKFKQETLTEICSILAYSSIKQGDPFFSFIANEELEILTKKSKKLSSVITMSEYIYNYNVLNKKAEYKKICDELFKTIKKKSIIFLIGDFFNIKDLDLKILSKKHELFLIVVRDRFEENPTALGKISLTDTTYGLDYDGVIDNESIKNYKAFVKQNDHKLFLHLQKCGIKFVKVYTNEEPISKLMGII
mgnify:CR=1 FL=1